MKLIIAVVLALITGITVFNLPTTRPSFKPVTVPPESYDETAKDISAKINDLSPTPPAENSWTVTEVEFAKDTAYVYVIYHDTRNIFRILIEAGENNQYRTVAAFEARGPGWKLTGGRDLADGKETAIIKINNQ